MLQNAPVIDLEAGWLQWLGDQFELDYMRDLKQFLKTEQSLGKIIYPPGADMFNAFKQTPPEQVRVVILGQDPYHGPGQAHGLSFSVPPGIKIPPSLANIYRELDGLDGFTQPEHGCLLAWAQRGVLLLNSVLSVEQGQAGSHSKRGWEQFTDRVVELLNQNAEGVVFMLWGAYAQRKGAMIDERRHCVLRAPHPSPLSAHRGFLGCGHFQRANDYLCSRGELAIDWSL